MSLSSEVGAPGGETARLAADRLGYELVTDPEILPALTEDRNLFLSFTGCEHLNPQGVPRILRVHLTGPTKARTTKRRPTPPPDIIIRMKDWTPEQAARIIEAAAGCRHPKGPVSPSKSFGHPSEEVFANLLDFYRIAWLYEPRSFPLQWSATGGVTEAFTPDFYLPESDLYVELTTMKQSHVTKKNRKIKLLKAIYPHINIQIFYQKDFEELLFKYGIRATD